MRSNEKQAESKLFLFITTRIICVKTDGSKPDDFIAQVVGETVTTFIYLNADDIEFKRKRIQRILGVIFVDYNIKANDFAFVYNRRLHVS